ncbi:hypothetical protein ACAX43_21115 [Paraburkholderia sp. IW21]|uniref:hypothetical protein n=1 Tax=Paraburkholderia sp. IW21 TaxID=3242488 RepID=UPI003521633F
MAERETAELNHTDTQMREQRHAAVVGNAPPFVATSARPFALALAPQVEARETACSVADEDAPRSGPANRGALASLPPRQERAATCLVTVTDGDSGMTVALRTNDPTSEQTQRISRAALHELRRHGMHGARIVMNGVQQTIEILEEEKHGH